MNIDDERIFGLERDLVKNHAMIIIGDMLEADGDLTFPEAIHSVKALLYDETNPKESLRKAELIDEGIQELAETGLCMELPLLRKEYTNQDGSPVTLEDYINDYGYISDEAGQWADKLYNNK
jgi:hypothetical protein